ncbi:hypothetical protein DL765_001376 [Monosporascus sp. GIB2]|nr:hypothetical protein DL765_001376 [Monosporascus sp. GIB2]
MPYYKTSQEWLHQSALLLEARPSTTRITTKYSISRPKLRKSKPSPSSDLDVVDASQEDTTTTAATPSAEETQRQQKPARAALVLKTYDPASGATLKYRTTKAAEVSRLVLALGRLAARMAGVPAPEDEDRVMADPGEEREKEKGEGAAAGGGGGGGRGGQAQTQAQGQQQGQAGGGGGGGGGGGKGKKKRGKK